jgi:hypothetical protein
MTYYLKYLKYKNKYLELKNMKGAGEKPLDDDKVKKLWNESKQKHSRTAYEFFPDINMFFINYCWIGPPYDDDGYNYGNGFFIFYIDEKPRTSNLLPKSYKYFCGNQFAVLELKLEDIGNLKDFKLHFPRANKPDNPLRFRTTIELKDISGNILPRGTKYDWIDGFKGWLYENGMFAKMKKPLDISIVCKLYRERNDNKKVFVVTNDKLKWCFSHYCWISPSLTDDDYNYGKGFFIYACKDIGWEKIKGLKEEYQIIQADATQNSSKCVNEHASRGFFYYAIKMIDIKNINTPETYTGQIPNLSYQTTIDLTAKDGTLIPKGTAYDFSHELDAFVYGTGHKATLRL